MLHVRLKRLLFVTPDRAATALLAVVVLLWLFDYFRGFGLFYHKGWAAVIAVAAVAATLVFLLLFWLGGLAFHWRFQFRIRSICLLTLAIAIVCSWLTAALAQARRQAAAIAWSAETVDFQYDWDNQSWSGGYSGTSRVVTPPEPIWLTQLFGIDFFSTPVTISLDGNLIHSELDLSRLDGFEHVRHVILHKLAPSKWAIDELKRFPEIEDIIFNQMDASSAAIGELSCLSRLRQIRFFSSSVSSGELSGLSQIPSLRYVSFQTSGFTDDAIPTIERLSQLEAIRFGNQDLPSEILWHVGHLTNLRVLQISSMIGDEQLKPIEPLVQLEELDLSRNNFSETAIRQLAGFPRLRKLDLTYTNINAAEFKLLGRLNQLRDLKLEQENLSDAKLDNLAASSQLETLDISNNSFTDGALKYLAKLTNLRALDISQTFITAAGAASLRLSLPGCHVIYTGPKLPPSLTPGVF